MPFAVGKVEGASRPASGPALRVLVIQPTGDKKGHYGIYTTKLSQALAHLGHSVVVCTNRLCPERYLHEPPAFTVRDVGRGALGFERFDQAITTRPLSYYYGYFRNSFLVTRAGLRAAHSEPFDVVYITDAEFLTAAVLLRGFGKSLPPIVMEVSAANFSFRDYPGALPKKLYKSFQREVFKSTLGRQIRAIAVLGEWHRPRLRAQLRLPETFPIECIPDGGDQPAERLDTREARRRLGIEYGGPLLMFFGMLRRDKGIDDLVHAAAQVRERDFRLVIAGSPMEYTETQIRALVERAGIADKTLLRLEYIAEEDVPLYFFACDALVLPYAASYRGGSGPLMKGACTYGRAVIASDVSEMGRLVREYGFGVLAAPGSSESLAGAITRFLRLPDEARAEMGRRAAALARANTWEAMAERFTRLFVRIIDTPARPPDV